MVNSTRERLVTLSGLAAILVLCGPLLPAAAGTHPLVLRLPDRVTTLPLSLLSGAPYLTVESVARTLEATVQDGPGGSVDLRWEGGSLRFTPNHRRARTAHGIAMLPAPARRRGSTLWLPVEAAALAARERFGADRVRWDASSRTLTVAASAPEVRAIRVGSHPDRTRVVLEATGPVDWAVTAEGDGRLVVALPGSAVSQAIVRREYRGGTLRVIEPVPGPSGAQVRLTFAGRTDRARWFALQDPFRIVVDLYRAAGPASSDGRDQSSKAYGAGNGHAGPGAGARPDGPPPAAGATNLPADTARDGGRAVAAAHPSSPVAPAANRGPDLPAPAAPAVPRPEAEPSSGTPIGAAQTARGVVAMASGAGAEPPGGTNRPVSLAAQGRSGPAGPPSPAAAWDATTPQAPGSSMASPGPADVPPPSAPGAVLTIVIDPGHGGKDTGAIGPRGLKEKDVVLDVGLRLRRLLTDRLGARVIMTRSDDTFVPLEERTAMANRARADFFISIHVNAAPQARASGVETYYLSREPSDISARASAARENLVLNLEGVSPREQDGLKAVLWDMAETLHMQESSAMAEMLLEDLGRVLRVETRGVKHGPFVVLMTAGMPSALVEVAFISNPSQERRLQADAYRHSIAVALSGGIERFAHRYQRRIGMQPPRPGPS